jgi:hypothetical protein
MERSTHTGVREIRLGAHSLVRRRCRASAEASWLWPRDPSLSKMATAARITHGEVPGRHGLLLSIFDFSEVGVRPHISDWCQLNDFVCFALNSQPHLRKFRGRRLRAVAGFGAKTLPAGDDRGEPLDEPCRGMSRFRLPSPAFAMLTRPLYGQGEVLEGNRAASSPSP